MAEYNPHAPHILGNEWVPIRNAHYVPDGVTERGYTFYIDHTTTPVSGAYYAQDIPGNLVARSCDFISVYPAGREHLTGPIKKLYIKPSAISVTNPASFDVTSGVAALLNPEDDLTLSILAPGSNGTLLISFDTETHAQVLFGKRILDLRIRYALASLDVGNGDNIHLGVRLNTEPVNFSGVESIAPLEVASLETFFTFVSTMSLTEMNPFWDANSNPTTQRTVLPWRFNELNRFRSGAAAGERLVVSLRNAIPSDGTPAGLLFLDLEVVYCEETRVLYGGFRTYDTTVSSFGLAGTTEFYNIGALAARLYNPATFTQGVTLAPGNYTVTIYHRDTVDSSVRRGAPTLHAVRPYYELPSLSTVRVNQSTTEGDTFTLAAENVFTHLTLHTASSIVTGVHAYGTSYGAPVYGSRTAIQEIEDNPSAGTGVQYPQVRFYARRFGDTTTPLTLTDVATGLSTVSITVAEFDALEEIVDGWREVTLRFATPPTFPVTADDVDWRWSATGELTGNQWQILVADGPTGSWGPVAAAAATGPATYWAPLGSAVGLTWQSPAISGSAFDSTSDATLIFSQDPPTVTGFAIEATSLEVTGVAQDCGVDPRCVPTAIFGNQLTWNAFGICDDWSVSQDDGWPDADSGQTWSHSGGSVPADYDVADGRGMHTQSTVNVSRNSTATAAAGVTVTDLTIDVGVSATATGDTLFIGPGIGTDTANIYQARLQFRPDGNAYLEVLRRVAGVQATIFTAQSVGTYAPNVMWSVHLRWRAGVIYARAWPSSLTEPDTWLATVADANLTSFTSVVLRSQTGAASTNVNPVAYWDNLVAGTEALVDGSLEIQRRDELTDWQTIMLASRARCVGELSDFEARVGVLSEYRIRTLNALDFTGPWVTGSGTIASPGVTINGDADSVLIFTSNEDVDASLAYVMQFDGQPSETFSFPEADTQTLQRMFGRDFFVALRPLERGGEQFTRTLLVSAAAISLPSLANFRDLRDLAWADLNYVCVRDELGNRWFANILVPEGVVRGARTVYLAQVQVTEVTDTPTPIDPGS